MTTRWASPVVAAVTIMVSQTAAAQATPANAPAASASAPSDRVKRDADKVFQMILLHSDKKPPVKAPVKEPSVGAAPAPSRSAPPAAATPQGNTLVIRPIPAPAAVPARPAVAADLPAPAALPAAPEPIPEVALPPTPAPIPSPVAAPVQAPPPPAPPPKLELLSSVEPEFPARLMRTLGSGRVLVQFDVAADGNVAQAEAVQSSHKGLEPAAVAAVRQWKFKPMTGSSTGVTELKFE